MSDAATLVAAPACSDFSTCKPSVDDASKTPRECTPPPRQWPLTSTWVAPRQTDARSASLRPTNPLLHASGHEPEHVLASSARAADEKTPFVRSPPSTIECTFHLNDATYVRHLDYSTYRTWTHFAELLRLWESELGIACRCIWDDCEDMQVGAGDWEARVRPGWCVDVVCSAYFDDERSDSEDDEGCGFEDRDGDDGEEGYWYFLDWYLERGVRGREWWFARWRRRVERDGVFVEGERGYLVGVFGLVGVGVAFWIVLLWC